MEKVLQDRSKPIIAELENTKRAIEELRPLITGAVGESKVEKEDPVVGI